MEVSPKRLIIALALVFFLGVLFAIVNGVYVEEEGTALPMIVYGVSFVSIILGGALVILFQWKISKVQMGRMLKLLPQEDRKVIQILLENNNSIEQNKLVALSGYSKVRISRLLKGLEERGVVKKTNLGNTNLVVLSV